MKGYSSVSALGTHEENDASEAQENFQGF